MLFDHMLSIGTTPLAETPVARQLELAVDQFRRQRAPLYETLARFSLDEPEILALADEARIPPKPHLLLAVAHFLLLRDLRQDDPPPGGVSVGEHGVLAAHFGLDPAAAEPGRGAAGSGAELRRAWRDFCLGRRGEIARLLATRALQTNEIGRCTALLPAFEWLARRHGGAPLALLELGASAGLNLLFDRYGYHYRDYQGGDRVCGVVDAPVALDCALRGPRIPPLPGAEMPAVDFRMGNDLFPLDLSDPDDRLWLRALVWPDHQRRKTLLERTLAMLAGPAGDRAAEPLPRVVAGDLLEFLPHALPRVPPGAVACVVHSFVVSQIPRAAHTKLEGLLTEHGRHHRLYRLSFELLDDGEPKLELVRYEGGRRHHELLAMASGHGLWLDWRTDGGDPR